MKSDKNRKGYKKLVSADDYDDWEQQLPVESEVFLSEITFTVDTRGNQFC